MSITLELWPARLVPGNLLVHLYYTIVYLWPAIPVLRQLLALRNPQAVLRSTWLIAEYAADLENNLGYLLRTLFGLQKLVEAPHPSELLIRFSDRCILCCSLFRGGNV